MAHGYKEHKWGQEAPGNRERSRLVAPVAAAANKNPQTYPFRSQYKESDMEMPQEQARTQTCI